MEQNKSILVVDDEKLIEDMMQTILHRHGCNTVSFTDPLKALKFFVDNTDRVVLVITDFNMPGMSGPELIKKALKVNPHVPVIAATGHPEEYNIADLKKVIKSIVAKPFTKAELIEAVDKALSETGVTCHAQAEE